MLGEVFAGRSAQEWIPGNPLHEQRWFVGSLNAMVAAKEYVAAPERSCPVFSGVHRHLCGPEQLLDWSI
jgi:hypothetical protein